MKIILNQHGWIVSIFPDNLNFRLVARGTKTISLALTKIELKILCQFHSMSFWIRH